MYNDHMSEEQSNKEIKDFVDDVFRKLGRDSYLTLDQIYEQIPNGKITKDALKTF